jgi:hypothetical protein
MNNSEDFRRRLLNRPQEIQKERSFIQARTAQESAQNAFSAAQEEAKKQAVAQEQLSHAIAITQDVWKNVPSISTRFSILSSILRGEQITQAPIAAHHEFAGGIEYKFNFNTRQVRKIMYTKTGTEYGKVDRGIGGGLRDVYKYHIDSATISDSLSLSLVLKKPTGQNTDESRALELRLGYGIWKTCDDNRLAQLQVRRGLFWGEVYDHTQEGFSVEKVNFYYPDLNKLPYLTTTPFEQRLENGFISLYDAHLKATGQI